MKTLRNWLLSLVAIVILIVVLAYADGATLPLNHTASVTGTVPASQAKVFALIANPAIGASWRPAVKSVHMLPPDNGRDHWIEDLGHGQTMTFLATHTDIPTRREVLLDVPGASYGGAWTYELSPGPTPTTTTLKITEAGFIHPPLYRFMMHHVMGMTYNLSHYLSDIQTAAPKL